MSVRWLCFSVYCGLIGAACSGAGAAPEEVGFFGDPTAITTSDASDLRVALYTSPRANPVRGKNSVRLDLSAASMGPSPELDVQLTTLMPAMGHGSGMEPELVDIEGHRYTFENVVLHMPGVWELRVAVSGDIEDELVFEFDVD